MKVSARNRRNYAGRNRRWAYPNLNESLHPKVQNKRSSSHPNPSQQPILLEVPQAAGNSLFGFRGKCLGEASMKALPKRKGNLMHQPRLKAALVPLNESPSKKEGKSRSRPVHGARSAPLNESPSEKEGKSEPVPILKVRSVTPQ